MPAIIASAPAKLILCGEHAVVYGRPAIALPLASIRAYARIAPSQLRSGVVVVAHDLRQRWVLGDDISNPLNELIASTLARLGCAPPFPDIRVAITSGIPIASGMGSGAAVATALVRALAEQQRRQLAPAEVSALVYASERRFHGTPSGIDNTVVAYEQPIWFQRARAEHPAAHAGTPDARPSAGPSATPLIEPIAIAAPFTLLIGDTGVRSATHAPVGEVRRRWQADPPRYEALFDEVGALVAAARGCLAGGQIAALGALLSQNHALLQQIGVSSPELDALVAAALNAGALGAKLSGAGWGGVMLALADTQHKAAVAQALRAAGACRVIETTVEAHSGAAAV